MDLKQRLSAIVEQNCTGQAVMFAPMAQMMLLQMSEEQIVEMLKGVREMIDALLEGV